MAIKTLQKEGGSDFLLRQPHAARRHRQLSILTVFVLPSDADQLSLLLLSAYNHLLKAFTGTLYASTAEL